MALPEDSFGSRTGDEETFFIVTARNGWTKENPQRVSANAKAPA